MSRAHNNPMSMLVNHTKQKSNCTQDELNQKQNHSKTNHRKTILDDQDGKKFNTDVLDDAMQELLDICQQYNDKMTMKDTSVESKESSSRLTKSIPSGGDKDNKLPMTNDSDNKHNDLRPTSKCSNMQQSTTAATSDNEWLPSGSIERLQQRQSKLQSQLDEVLQAAKALAIRQKRKLKCILEDDDEGTFKDDPNGQNNDVDDDEDELLEFQQIENELRISDLNRQLDSIQEELRIRLFKRLMSNTNNRYKPQKQNDQTVPQQQTGCPNSHTDESSPSSSSCSDDLTTTSNSDTSRSVTDKAPAKSKNLCNQQVISNRRLDDSTDELDGRAGVTEQQYDDFKTPGSRSQKEIAGTVNANNEFLSNYNIDRASLSTNSKTSSTSSTTPTNNQSDLDSALDYTRYNEIMTPTTSKESLGSSEKRGSPCDSSNLYSNISTLHNAQQQNIAQAHYPSYFSHINHYGPIYSSNGGHRNNSVNSDLERIEEDEEDCQDYYCDSNHFRTIYEEKLSPIIHGDRKLGFKQQHDNINAFELSRVYQASRLTETENDSNGDCQIKAQNDRSCNAQQQQLQQPVHINQQYDPSTETSYDRLTESSNYNNNSFSAPGCSGSSTSSGDRKKTSRPLTLYLPRPDEEIDLVEHIQALGHDLDIISNDLKLNSTSALGYLWKSCSNNNKKWLKRYFYFDRNLKVLSYYENENQLVKKHLRPKNSISFEEISDVYVDHKLSGIGEKDRSSKRKNYVFVLATIGRKYLLASSRVETMRAWIDILFTAAKANDYFQQLSAIGDDGDDDDEDGCSNAFAQHGNLQ